MRLQFHSTSLCASRFHFLAAEAKRLLACCPFFFFRRRPVNNEAARMTARLYCPLLLQPVNKRTAAAASRFHCSTIQLCLERGRQIHSRRRLLAVVMNRLRFARHCRRPRNSQGGNCNCALERKPPGDPAKGVYFRSSRRLGRVLQVLVGGIWK